MYEVFFKNFAPHFLEPSLFLVVVVLVFELRALPLARQARYHLSHIPSLLYKLRVDAFCVPDTV